MTRSRGGDVGPRRRLLGIATLLLFFALATPNPIQTLGGPPDGGGASAAAQGSVCRLGE